MDSGSTGKYLLYAVGEIFLVMIGILLALQVNNWNEARQAKSDFKMSMLALADDIRNDTAIIQRYISNLSMQKIAADLIIPILESREKEISDSLEFISAFMRMSNSIQIDMNSEIWDEIRKSGLLKAYADPILIKSLQDYYHDYTRYAQNWENEMKPRMEIRVLKYELFSQPDLNKIRMNKNPRPPSKKAFEAIFGEKRVVNLTKHISYTSFLFMNHFSECKFQAMDILKAIEHQYGHSKDTN